MQTTDVWTPSWYGWYPSVPERTLILFQMPRCSSPEEPPFHMQHFKLPHMLALQSDDDPQQA